MWLIRNLLPSEGGKNPSKQTNWETVFRRFASLGTLALLICQDSYNVYFHTKFMLHVTRLSLVILNVFSSSSGKAPFLTFLPCAMLRWKFISSGLSRVVCSCWQPGITQKYRYDYSAEYFFSLKCRSWIFRPCLISRKELDSISESVYFKGFTIFTWDPLPWNSLPKNWETASCTIS